VDVAMDVVVDVVTLRCVEGELIVAKIVEPVAVIVACVVGAWQHAVGYAVVAVECIVVVVVLPVAEYGLAADEEEK